MTTRNTTIGRIMLENILPEDVHHILDETELTKTGIQFLMEEVAATHPDSYTEILHKLNRFGSSISSTYGDKASLDLESLIPSPQVRKLQTQIYEGIKDVVRSIDDPLAKKERILEMMENSRAEIEDEILKNFHRTPFGEQAASGLKGGTSAATDIIGGEMLALDSDHDFVPYPLNRGYSEGLTPLQYWLSAQKARSGLIGVKLSTPEAGDLAKQLMEATHRLRITQEHEPREYENIGLPVSIDDPDYEGSIISKGIEGVVGTGAKLTPEVIQELKEHDIDTVLIHSPITSLVENGISRDSIGDATDYRYELGDFAGIIASQALTERLSQAMIGSKHGGTRRSAGLEAFNQLISVPKRFKGRAALAPKSGIISSIEELDDGTHRIKIGGEEELVQPGFEVRVSKGDKVKKGDILSEGLPNPAEMVELFGIGGGRKKFAEIMSNEFSSMGIGHNKRLTEFLARGLINHVEMTERYGGYYPEDIVEVADIVMDWEPEESVEEKVSLANGKYLTRPIAYHLPGTKVDKDMIKELQGLGIDKVEITGEKPPFEPVQRWGRGALSSSSDWMLRLYGSSAKRNLLEAMFTGQTETDVSREISLISQLATTGLPRDIKADETSTLERMTEPLLDVDQLFLE